MSESTTRPRPFGVTLLVILAGITALEALWHTLQYLHIMPFSLGPMQFYGFDILGAILWGVTAAIWIWAAINLWNLRRDALTFVTIIAGWNLILAVISLLGASTLSAVLPSLALNILILIYVFTPQVREAFGVA